MATRPKNPNRGTTPQERTEQLQQVLAAREAARSLDTFEAAVPPQDGAASSEPSAPLATAARVQSGGVKDAAQTTRARIAEDEIELGGGNSGGLSGQGEPVLPGQQTNESGVNTAGNAPTGVAGSRQATSGDDSTAAELDASVQAALGQLAGARAGLSGPADVFEAAADAGTTRADASPSSAGRSGTPDELFGGSDGGADKAAEVAGQVQSDGRFVFGSRLSGANAGLGIAAGLFGDQAAVADSPSVAQGVDDTIIDGEVIFETGSGIADTIVDGAAEIAETALQVLPDAVPAIETAGRVVFGGAAAVSPVARAGSAGFAVGAAIQAVVLEPTGASDAIVDAAVAATEAGEYEAEQTRKAEAAAKERAAKEAAQNPPPVDQANKQKAGPGLVDPGDPNNPDGLPTQAQMAFRQALKDALGVRATGRGDVDPADESPKLTGAQGSLGLGDTANNNDSLIGQSAGPGSEAGGRGHVQPGGADVDPLEGSAFAGPALGGTPESLEFGSTSLGLDAANRDAPEEDDSDSKNVLRSPIFGVDDTRDVREAGRVAFADHDDDD